MLFMKTLTNILVPVGVIAVLAVLVIFLLPVLMILIGLAFLAAFICWACGMPLTIKVNNKQVGYVRWFKYTRL